MLQAFYTELEDHDEIDVSPFRKLGRNRRKVVMKESYAQPIYLLQDEFTYSGAYPFTFRQLIRV